MTTLPTLYIKGTFNGWGLDTPLVTNLTGQYKATICLSSDKHAFKITDQDGSDQWTFSGHPINATTISLNKDVSLIQTQGIGNDLHFQPKQTGRFDVVVTIEKSLAVISISPNQVNHEPKIKRRGLDHHIDDIAYAPHQWQDSDNHQLSANKLFSQIAIQKKSPFSFVFGDNQDGYYEGKTHTFANAGKYRHSQGWYLGTFASFVNGKINDKTCADHATLQAFGIEHHYDNAVIDTLSIIAEQRTACLSINSQNPNQLSIVPELNIALNQSTVDTFEQGVIYELAASECPDGAPSYIAVAANKACNFREITFTDYPELDSIMHLSGDNVKLAITSQKDECQLDVYLCFAHSKQEVIQQAQSAIHDDLINKNKQSLYHFLCTNYLWTNDLEYNRALMWARLASRTFVNHEFGAGIWAGLPWFKDCWGRDTFIALSGTSLINGRFAEAKEVITNFASMQMTDTASINFGRVPNRVTSLTNIIYNTTDGTPWMIREIMEYLNYSGDQAFAKEIYPVIKRFIEGIEQQYLDEHGLMTHRDPDTWMDAKINGQVPWSPRGNRANDIQALWFASLQSAIILARLNNDHHSETHWTTLLDKVKNSVETLFWNKDTQQLADRLEADGTPDYSIRPNQLMTLTVPLQTPLLSPEIGQKVVSNTISELLFPWGICSLSQYDTLFHPYHDNQEHYHKDSAYHNGTIWGWNAGFTVSSLTMFGGVDLAYQLSKNLGQQITEQGHIGTMSENLDAWQKSESHLVESGTYAQAWSVSEYARNAQQDYLGFKPDLLNNLLLLHPKLPTLWHQFNATLPFGNSDLLNVTFQRESDDQQFILQSSSDIPLKLVLKLECQNGNRIEVSTALDHEIIIGFNVKTGKVTSNMNDLTTDIQSSLHSDLVAELEFSQPDRDVTPQSMLQSNYLRTTIENQTHQVAID